MHIQVSLIVDIDATADLSTIEHQIHTAGHHSMREALQKTIRQWEQEHRTCPQSGSQQVRLEGTVRRTISALFGTVHLARQRIRCQNCFHRFCPANDLFQGMHQGRVSPALAEVATIAGSSWPYRQAAQVLARLSGAHISAEEIRLVTNRRGHVLALEQEHNPPASQEHAPQINAGVSSSRPDRAIIGLDGGWVPCRYNNHPIRRKE